MTMNYETIFKEFRRRYSSSRLFASSVGISVLLSLYLMINNMKANSNLSERPYLYFFLMIGALIVAIGAYTYLYNFRLMKSLEVLDPILYDHADPKSYTDYLQATIRFDKRKSVPPALWIAYLKGLSYLGKTKEMKDIMNNHSDILKDNIQYKAFEFNVMAIVDQRKSYDRYYDTMSKRLKSMTQIESLKIKGHFLKQDYDTVIESLKLMEPYQNTLLDKVSWNFQMSQALVLSKQKEEAKPYLTFVIDHGNTSYYVEEAKKLRMT